MSDLTVQNEPDKKAELPATAPSSGKSPASMVDIVYNESITISPGKRIPQYDKGPVKAYAATGSDKIATNLFAMICEDQLTPRTHKASNYAAIINPSLVRLVASGPVDWTPIGRQRYCFIYENTLGNPLMVDDSRGGCGMRAEAIMNSVIRPIIHALADMRDKDIVHGNIRPNNIFDGGSKILDRVILGECLSTPISYNQPALYEPINRALTSPAGRGMGMPQDDLYSFGVTLAMLMRHMDPLEGMSDAEVIEKKMEESTFSALLSRDRITGPILELLRGILQDDEAQRWTLDEVLQWLDGRRLSPKQGGRRPKAARPILFNGEKYTRPEFLARDIHKNINELKTITENGELEQWLSRAVEDKVMTARYETALSQSEDGGKGPGYAEKLATRVAIALHPEGPIRYKNISMMPDGAGVALSEAFIMKRDLQTYVDFFMNYFITQWVDVQPGAVSDVSNLVSKFDSARAYLRHKGMGWGLERCVYALNAEQHCLSEKLAKFQIRSPEEMMFAYEKISRSPGRPAMFFDRHIIAYLSVKERKNIDPYMNDLNAPETYKRVMGEMKTLATLQKRSQMGRFPGIAGWMIDNLGPVYDRFHDRQLRTELKEKAEKLREGGDLAKIAMLFDDMGVYQEDNASFRRAMRKYHDLDQETTDLERELKNEATLGRYAGQKVAAITATILALIIILTTFFMSGASGPKPF